MNKELSANTAFSHYRIVSKIGAGGMGDAYLAQGTKLDRKVSLRCSISGSRSWLSPLIGADAGSLSGGHQRTEGRANQRFPGPKRDN